MGLSISSGIYYGVSSGFFNSFSSNSSSSASPASYITEYANIKSGSYYKLMKAYYGGNSTAEKLVNSGNSAVADDADKKKTVAIRDDASALKESAAELLKTGDKSVFNKVEKTDENGVKTKDYDMDKIYKSVSSFVDDYNSLIKSADKSDNNSVIRTTANMINSSKANSKMLAEIGIKINSDYTLSVDEKALKASSGSDIKSLFNGTGSYAYNVSYSASQVYNQSVSQLAKMSGASYSSAGGYNYSYSGSNYSKYL